MLKLHKHLKWSKYAKLNFAYQHISLRFKFLAYLAAFWPVKKIMQMHIHPGPINNR